jgi:hypothetical protein
MTVVRGMGDFERQFGRRDPSYVVEMYGGIYSMMAEPARPSWWRHPIRALRWKAPRPRAERLPSLLERPRRTGGVGYVSPNAEYPGPPPETWAAVREWELRMAAWRRRVPA